MQLFGQALISGLLLGSLYGTIAIGLTLTWGMLKVINLSHFSFAILAGYITYQLSITTGMNPFLTMLVTIPMFFLVGVLLQWFIEIFHIDEFMSLLVTFGLFIILESVMRWFWTADHRFIPSALNPYLGVSLWVGPFALPIPQLASFLAAVLISVLTMYILHRTYAGKALRALAQDREIAGAFGVNYRRSAMMLSGMAGAYAAIAGAFISMIYGVTPTAAIEWLPVIFAVVILGGLANAFGAFAAGLIIGVTDHVTSAVADAGIASLVTFVILILALLLKPEGLFARRAAE
ncbi:MAG: branched-chain amino acid ABC transporter permease [Planctomycetaceae bacterium]|nr:MAG: branched-chain amino acid ABC transporter permease [Planctomycetaceae bacterium]